MIDAIRRRMAAVSAARSQRLAERKRADLEATARGLIQAKEWDGVLYLAYGGEALVPADMLRAPLPEALEDARRRWVGYMMTRPRRY